MKKVLSLLAISVISLTTLCGCNMGGGEQNGDNDTESRTFDTSKKITVVTREEGAGLRGVVADLFGFLRKETEGDNTDLTFEGAAVRESADEIRTAVADDKYAISYLPLTSVTDKVKALKVNGVAPSTANVKNGNYSFKHKLVAVTTTETGEVAQDFLNFVLSEEGQNILMDNGYISNGDTGAFTTKKPEGTLEISAASSSEPAIKKLCEEYKKLNDKLKIEITKENSKDAIDGVDEKDDIAFITRTLSDKEKESHKENTVCEDAIAVVVNKENTLSNITSEQVRSIYKGEITKWSEIIK